MVKVKKEYYFYAVNSFESHLSSLVKNIRIKFPELKSQTCKGRKYSKNVKLLRGDDRCKSF